METLEERYRKDPFLLKLNMEGLLIPGWAGQVDNVETEYIARKLNKSWVLRRKWQVHCSTRYPGRITPSLVKRMVREWK